MVDHAPAQPWSFVKMHGLGNDFVVLDAREQAMRLTAGQVVRIADRRRGVGCDQLIRIEPAGLAGQADARLTFFNADGSEAGACGNGTRCVAGLLLSETGRGELTLETAAGALRAWSAPGGQVTVAMAAPRFGWREIPLAEAVDTMAMPIDQAGLARPVGLGLGNPHAVFFTPDLAAVDIATLGPQLERHPLFPERANIGFAQLLDDATLRLRVWERGAGLTPACGSGACAALVAAVRRGMIASKARLVLDGGELEGAWDGAGPVLMTGPIATAFEGVLTGLLLDG